MGQPSSTTTAMVGDPELSERFNVYRADGTWTIVTLERKAHHHWSGKPKDLQYTLPGLSRDENAGHLEFASTETGRVHELPMGLFLPFKPDPELHVNYRFAVSPIPPPFCFGMRPDSGDRLVCSMTQLPGGRLLITGHVGSSRLIYSSYAGARHGCRAMYRPGSRV